jgi:hypothetical protein
MVSNGFELLKDSDLFFEAPDRVDAPALRPGWGSATRRRRAASHRRGMEARPAASRAGTRGG